MAKPTSPGKALDHAAEQAQPVLADVPPIITPPDHPLFPDTSAAPPAQSAAIPEAAQIPEAVQLPEWLF